MQPLLDAVLDYLPEPARRPAGRGRRRCVKGGDEPASEIARRADDSEPFAALAFKIMADPFVGKLTYFRVYSGKLEAGSRVLNVTTGKTERVGRILMMHANDREEVDEVYAGDIAAGVGIKQIVTGDTLCAPDAPIKLETIDVPRAGHQGRRRAEDEGPTRRRCRSPSAAWPRRTRRSRSRPTRRPARPRSPAWASCTSRSSSTA